MRPLTAVEIPIVDISNSMALIQHIILTSKTKSELLQSKTSTLRVRNIVERIKS